MMNAGKVIIVSVYVLLGAIISSVQANPIGRQVGLSTDVQVLTINETEVCQVGGNIYQANDDLPTEDPCEYCTCQPPGLACEVIKCSYKPGCRSLQRAGLCCPEFICDCEFEGKIYQNGDRIKMTSNPCEDCYCITGEVKCSVISCSYPPSSSGNCLEIPVEGECCPTYNCSQPIEEETTTAVGKVSSAESITEQQEDTQETSHPGLEIIPALPTESQTVIESNDAELQVVPEEEEDVATELETENSIFIQILPLQTSTSGEAESPITEPPESSSTELTEKYIVESTEGLNVESTENPAVELTESPTVEPTEHSTIEIDSGTTERFVLTEQVTTEKQPEVETLETTTFGEYLSETSTKLVFDAEPLTKFTQATITEDETAVEPTDESTTYSGLDKDAITETTTLYASEVTDVYITEKEILNDITEITTFDELPADTTEIYNIIPAKEEIKLPTVEESFPSDDEIAYSELKETFSIDGDSDSEAIEFIASEPVNNPTELYAQDEKSTENATTDDTSSAQPTEQTISDNISTAQPTEETTVEDISSRQPTEQATSDDFSISTTTRIDLYHESEKFELTTSNDITNEPTTILVSEITELLTTPNTDELTTEFKETALENSDTENGTPILNNEETNDNLKDLEQHISAPANKIEKYDNFHENKIDKEDDLFADASELVIDEESFVRVSTLGPQEFATTEEILEQTTKLSSYEEQTTEVQISEDVTADVYTTELSSDDKYKSEIIELERDQFEQEITSKANDVSTTETYISEVTDEDLIHAKPDELTTNVPNNKLREEDTDDYWSKMTMGKNNPIEVMKEIAKIAEPTIKEDSNSTFEETIIPDDSTKNIRSDIENIESSTLPYDNAEEVTEENNQESVTDEVELTTKYVAIKETVQEYTQESVTDEVELTTKYAEVKETTNEETKFEDVLTSVSTDEFTSDISVDSKFRNNINDEAETSTQLYDSEFTTSKYQTESANTDILETTQSITVNQETEQATIAEEQIKDYVTARSETQSIHVDEEKVTGENISSLDKVTESKILDKKENNDETQIENSSEEITNKNESVIDKTEQNNNTKIENQKIIKDSDIHVIDKILSNGSVTKIETHTSEGKPVEETKRRQQMLYLHNRYGLRPLAKRVIRDPFRKPKVRSINSQTRRSFLRRRQ